MCLHCACLRACTCSYGSVIITGWHTLNQKNNSSTNFYLSLSLARGVSRWFANCQTNRPRAFFPCLALVAAALPEKFIILESARSRGGHGAGARAAGGGRHERYMAASLLLPHRLCVYVCVRERKRASHLKVDMY